MAVADRARDRGMAASRVGLRGVGADVRHARIGAGLSLDAAARSVGLDPSMYSRIERGLAPAARLRDLALACAAVGLRLGVRAYPDGDPVRDAGHRRLLDRLHARLAAAAPWHTEVPLPIPGDQRAVDAVTTLRARRVGFEAETRLGDTQALDRRAQLKRRDAELDVLILVVADTPHNRRVLENHREALRANYPLDTRAVLRDLVAGRPPRADGIVII